MLAQGDFYLFSLHISIKFARLVGEQVSLRAVFSAFHAPTTQPRQTMRSPSVYPPPPPQPSRTTNGPLGIPESPKKKLGSSRDYSLFGKSHYFKEVRHSLRGEKHCFKMTYCPSQGEITVQGFLQNSKRRGKSYYSSRISSRSKMKYRHQQINDSWITRMTLKREQRS